MKHKILMLNWVIAVIMVVLASLSARSQCTPMGPEDCPDPENNGQVCPDTMPVGYLNQAYQEEATILVPEQYMNATIHHLTLIDIGNLPMGIGWESNVLNNEFLAGNYYCMVLEGTPTKADTFYLKIIIDVYLDILGQPVFFARITDSTSLAMIINEDFGVEEGLAEITLEGNFPNPFNNWTTIRFEASRQEAGILEVYSLMGEKLYSEMIMIKNGSNAIPFNGGMLVAGSYFYVIRLKSRIYSGIFIRNKQ